MSVAKADPSELAVEQANATILPRSDVVILGGGVVSPGRATLVRCSRENAIDIRKGVGFMGATIWPTGQRLAELTFEFFLWESTQFVQWQLFAAALQLSDPGPLKPPVGIGIYHPALATPPLKITSVVTKSITAFAEDDDGGFTCLVDFVEFRKPLPVIGKPDASIPAVSKAPVPAVTEARRTLERLTAQRDALAAR